MTQTTTTSDHVSVMDVATRLRKRYQAARDLMLSGKLGEPRYERKKLQVPRASFEAYCKERKL